MNTINNHRYMYQNPYQTNMLKSAKNEYDGWESAAGQIMKNTLLQHKPDAEITAQNAYEKMSTAMKILPERKQSAKTVPETAQDEPKEPKVIECSVASLDNGITFYFNDETGEVSCVNDNDPRPGRQVLWSKTLSKDELKKCDKLFETYEDREAGGFVFRFQAYLGHEEFWDRYLEDKVDLKSLKQENNVHTTYQ